MILANSKFTARVFATHFPSIPAPPRVVYPGINLAAYEASAYDTQDQDVLAVVSCVPPSPRCVYCTEARRSAATAPRCCR